MGNQIFAEKVTGEEQLKKPQKTTKTTIYP